MYLFYHTIEFTVTLLVALNVFHGIIAMYHTVPVYFARKYIKDIQNN